jgi:hypothetical protein
MGSAKYAARMREIRNKSKILIRNPEGEILLGRLLDKWGIMGLKIVVFCLRNEFITLDLSPMIEFGK